MSAHNGEEVKKPAEPTACEWTRTVGGWYDTTCGRLARYRVNGCEVAVCNCGKYVRVKP